MDQIQKSRPLVSVSTKNNEVLSIREVETHLIGIMSRVGKIIIIRTPETNFNERVDVAGVPTSY